MSTARRQLRPLLLLPWLPLVLAACGSASTGGSPPPASDGTPTTPSDATVYELCSTPGDMDREAFLAAGRRSVPAERTGHVRGSIQTGGGGLPSGSATGVAGGEVDLEGDFDASDADNPKVSMTVDLGGTSMTVLLVDKAAYLRLGELTGGKYATVTAEQLRAQGGLDFTETTNPAGQLEKQKDAIVTVTCVGREDLDGRSTAHLRLTLDPAKMAAKPTATGTRSGSTDAATPAESSATTITTEHWIDDRGRTWKVTSQLPQGGATFSYSKWGEPVTITAPPAAQVTTMPGALRS